MARSPGIHRRYYDDRQEISAPKPDFYLLDTYYAVSRFAPGFTGIALRLVAGMVLLLASKPLARLISRKLDAF
ncbi:MAG: hypothetical protein M3463_02235 [Verrucomicrobiota bacterium]|nr:hypothetical protein [Verrucomicrobiota bacterium]